MPTNRPDPGDFLELAQRMLRELFGDQRSEDDPWEEATRRGRDHTLGTGQQRDSVRFALATRAVEALEDLALNVAAIRQRLERTTPRSETPRTGSSGTDGVEPTEE